jgi:3-oxoacyl-[acyl-carrier protein] reductase
MASKLASCGATVVITGRDEVALKAACKTLGERAKYIVFDSLNFENYDKFFNEVNEIMPDYNSIVLNAGISLHEGTFENVSIDGFQKQFDTNLKSPYFMVKEFVAKCKAEEAQILFISSETADFKCTLPYGLTKASINSLVPALSEKLYHRGIRVNAIAPGSTLTNMVKNANDDSKNINYSNFAERYFLPEEVAEVAAFLLSNAAKCISGEIIHTNAGNHHRVQ